MARLRRACSGSTVVNGLIRNAHPDLWRYAPQNGRLLIAPTHTSKVHARECSATKLLQLSESASLGFSKYGHTLLQLSYHNVKRLTAPSQPELRDTPWSPQGPAEGWPAPALPRMEPQGP
jgi:hypothetical protein